MAVNWLNVVTSLTSKGFTKVCIVNKSFQVVGASANECVPAAYKKKDNEKERLINENQELQNDWPPKEGTFYFFKEQWNVFGNDNSALGFNANGSKGTMLFARERNDHWIIAVGKVKSPMAAKKAKGEFKTAAGAIKKLEKAFQDNDLEEED